MSNMKDMSFSLATQVTLNYIHNTMTPFSPECPRCVLHPRGLTCCKRGGSWHGKCGHPGEPNIEHTWEEGLKVCGSAIPPTTTTTPPMRPPTRQSTTNIIVFTHSTGNWVSRIACSEACNTTTSLRALPSKVFLGPDILSTIVSRITSVHGHLHRDHIQPDINRT